MRPYPILALLLAPVAAAAQVSVAGHEQSRSYDCKGEAATVTGHDNTLQFTDCSSLNLAGHHNRVRVERVAQVTLAGHDNRLTWSGEKPAIVVVGRNNTAEAAAGAAPAPSAPSAAAARPAPPAPTPPAARSARPAAAAAPPQAASATAKPLSIGENGQTRTHDCGGGDAVIDGNDNVLDLSHCTVRVNGNRNKVSLSDCPSLALWGNQNGVTWQGSRPAVSDLGTGNSVTQR